MHVARDGIIDRYTIYTICTSDSNPSSPLSSPHTSAILSHESNSHQHLKNDAPTNSNHNDSNTDNDNDDTDEHGSLSSFASLSDFSASQQQQTTIQKNNNNSNNNNGNIPTTTKNSSNEVTTPSITGLTPSWKPILILVPLRLGLDKINPLYIDTLKDFFQFKQNVGIIGGRPRQSLYFVGYQGN
jgi:hypothetical protein